MPNQPHLDYLRLATFDFQTYIAIARTISDHAETESGRWLQYKGRRNENNSVFHGTGEQLGKRHYIIQFSGPETDKWYDRVRTNAACYQLYATRIDLQVTIKEPEEHDARKLYQAVSRKTKSIVQNPETSTVYIGARTSDLFTRIYEKELSERYLRCEFELKGMYAKAAWGKLLLKEVTREDLYNSGFHKAHIPQPWADWFKISSDCTTALTYEEELENLGNKLFWLKNTEIALMKYLDHHDTQQAVTAMVYRLMSATRQIR